MDLGLEMLKNSFLEIFWSDFGAWAWKIIRNSFLDGFWKDHNFCSGPPLIAFWISCAIDFEFHLGAVAT